MADVRSAAIRRLRGLKTIAWMTRARIDRLAAVLTVTEAEKSGTIFDDRHPAISAFILLSGVARITCRNRKGERALVIMVAPWMIHGMPPEDVAVIYHF